jgi:hypothetical protein
MHFLLVVIGTLSVVEVFIRLRVEYRRNLIIVFQTASGSLKTIRSKTLTDTSKEHLLKQHSYKLLIQTLIVSGLVLITVFPMGCIVVATHLQGVNILDFLITLKGSLVSIASGTIYALARARTTHG